MKKQLLFTLAAGMVCFNAAAQWVTRAPMSGTRSQHVASVLNDGRVLVAGGWDFTTNLTSAEVFDPAANTWTATANNMASEHSTAAAVTLGDGSVLVMGGYTGSINTTDCDKYTPGTNSWAPAGSLNLERSYHTATVLQDGKVLITGGYTGTENTNSCELYDPAMDSWTLTGSLNTGRSYHTATMLNDGKVLVAGGYNPAAGFQLNACEIYDPATGLWTTAGPLTDARDWHSASLLSDGRVMVAGGEYFTGGTPYAYDGLLSAEIYNPATDNWTTVSNMPAGLCFNKQFSSSLGAVIVVAGEEQVDYGTSPSFLFTYVPGTTYIYGISSDFWAPLPMNSDGRLYSAAVQLADERIVVTGGSDGTVEVLEALTGLTEATNGEHINVFPNPATETAIMQLDEAAANYSITLTDMQGKSFTPGITTNQNTATLQLQNIPAGVYVVKAQHSSKTLVQRLTVVK